MAISFVLVASFPRWHTDVNDAESEVDVKPFPSRPVSQVAQAAMSLAAILVLVSALWQHIATATAASMGGSLAYGTVRGGVGTAAMVLGWGGLLLISLGAIGLLFMILSIQVLHDLD